MSDSICTSSRPRQLAARIYSYVGTDQYASGGTAACTTLTEAPDALVGADPACRHNMKTGKQLSLRMIALPCPAPQGLANLLLESAAPVDLVKTAPLASGQVVRTGGGLHLRQQPVEVGLFVIVPGRLAQECLGAGPFASCGGLARQPRSGCWHIDAGARRAPVPCGAGGAFAQRSKSQPPRWQRRRHRFPVSPASPGRPGVPPRRRAENLRPGPVPVAGAAERSARYRGPGRSATGRGEVGQGPASRAAGPQFARVRRRAWPPRRGCRCALGRARGAGRDWQYDEAELDRAGLPAATVEGADPFHFQPIASP